MLDISESTDKSWVYQDKDKIVLSTGVAGLFTQSSQNSKYDRHLYEKSHGVLDRVAGAFVSVHSTNTG